jgi:hypothetical protein
MNPTDGFFKTDEKQDVKNRQYFWYTAFEHAESQNEDSGAASQGKIDCAFVCSYLRLFFPLEIMLELIRVMRELVG